MSHRNIKWIYEHTYACVLSDHKIQTYNLLVHRGILNYLAKLARVVFVYEMQPWTKIFGTKFETN